MERRVALVARLQMWTKLRSLFITSVHAHYWCCPFTGDFFRFFFEQIPEASNLYLSLYYGDTRWSYFFNSKASIECKFARYGANKIFCEARLRFFTMSFWVLSQIVFPPNVLSANIDDNTRFDDRHLFYFDSYLKKKREKKIC